MLICIAGKNDLAVEGLSIAIQLKSKYLFDLGILCNKTETGKNGWNRSLRWFAQKNNIKEYTLEELYEIEDLLFLSLEYDSIVKPSKFKTKKLFNVHFSYLPQYKGMYTSAIPLLNGENYSGVTLHFIDAGIDTGRIIAQKKFEIAKHDTCRDLYFKYIQNGIDMIKENMERLIVEGEGIYSIKQTAEGASYYSRKYLDYSNIIINLNQVSDNIHNQLRAYHFREYQLPMVNGKRVIASELTAVRSTDKAGTVITENDQGCLIATVDNNLMLYWDRFEELMDACKKGNISKVCEICSVKEHINQADEHGWTPLIVAAYHGQYEVVQYLILNGADINAVNYNGTNLLMYAKDAFIYTGKTDIFELFIRLGLSLERKDYEGFDLKYYCKIDNIQAIGSINVL